MARYKTIRLSKSKTDSVTRYRNREIQLQYDSKPLLGRILGALDEITRKDAADFIGYIIKDKIDEYVPKNTRQLSLKGYYMSNKASLYHCSTTIRYRNTSKLKYVMYQYRGIVYGPNKAILGSGTLANGRKTVNLKPEGWWSPRVPKKPSDPIRELGQRRRIALPNGQKLLIEGYTKNPNAHARWVEYVRDTPEIWVPLTKRIYRDTKDVFYQLMTREQPSMADIYKIHKVREQFKDK